jgi:DNA-binding protein H-NS
VKVEAILDSLGELQDDALRIIETRCRELQAQHDRERKEKAMADAAATLAAAGLTFKDLVAGKGKAKPVNGPAYHGGRRYQHPANKALVWNAKGQKPNWLRELEAQGGKAVEVGNA